jgi:hypothetical protein
METVYVPQPRRPTLARRKYDFLRCLLRWGTTTEAAVRIGVDRRTVNRWRLADPVFDRDCEDRLAWRREAIVLAATDRLSKRSTRPVLHRGRQLGHLARANDRVLVALLRTEGRQPVSSSRPPRGRNVPLVETADTGTAPDSADGTRT